MLKNHIMSAYAIIRNNTKDDLPDFVLSDEIRPTMAGCHEELKRCEKVCPRYNTQAPGRIARVTLTITEEG